jgi:hypothetical protein
VATNRFLLFIDWSYDTSRDVLSAKYLVEYHQFGLAQPHISGRSLIAENFVRNSPLYYYILAGAWGVTHSISGIIGLVVLCHALSVVLIYRVGVLLRNQKTGMVLAVLYGSSFFFTSLAKNIWQPYFLPFFTLLALYLLLRFIRFHKILDLLLMTATLFGALHFHMSFLTVAVVFFILAFPKFWQLPRLPKWVVVSFFALNTWLYLIATKTSSIWDTVLFMVSINGTVPTSSSPLQIIVNGLIYIFHSFSDQFPTLPGLVIGVLLAVTLGFALFILIKSPVKSDRASAGIILSLLGSVFLSSLYVTEWMAHYFIPLHLFILMALGWMLGSTQPSKGLSLLTNLVTIGLIFVSLQATVVYFLPKTDNYFMPFTTGPDFSLGHYPMFKDIADIINADVQQQHLRLEQIRIFDAHLTTGCPKGSAKTWFFLEEIHNATIEHTAPLLDLQVEQHHFAPTSAAPEMAYLITHAQKEPGSTFCPEIKPPQSCEGEDGTIDFTTLFKDGYRHITLPFEHDCNFDIYVFEYLE